jgi:phosphatidylinositol alpha-mannosyltransferase
MKIGFVFDDSLDKADGVQQYILSLGRWMSADGHEVHYLVGETKRTDIPRIHSLSRNLRAHFNQNRMSTPLPASKAKIRALLEKENFDVLHVQMPYSPFMAGRVIKAAPKRTAVVGTFHIIPFSGLEKLATRALRVVLRRSMKRFDAIYSVSRPAQKFAKKSFRAKSEVIPNVVALSHFQNGKKPKKWQDDKLNIVFLGRLVERKGCLHLLEALKYLNDRNELQRIRVLICGKGPLQKQLEKFVQENKLKSIVKFMGFVDEDEKPNYLASADIAVFPSTGGESFGIVLIEAMAAGAKVVLAGNNVGYASVMGGHKEQLVKPQNTKAFAKTLKHFMDNFRARRHASLWQAEHVQQYDVRKVGQELIDSYTYALSKRP